MAPKRKQETKNQSFDYRIHFSKQKAGVFVKITATVKAKTWLQNLPQVGETYFVLLIPVAAPLCTVHLQWRRH